VTVEELLPLFALGLLEGDEADAVRDAVARDAGLAAQLVDYQSASEAMIAPIAPPSHVRDRLLASVGGGRFEPFAARLATMYDVSVDRARELLSLIERPASYEPQIPGVWLVHFEGGPAYTEADCGFIKVAKGGMFPPHRHLGEEAALIITGTIRDMKSGTLLRPGDNYVQAEGTDHYLVADGEEDCIFAARAMNGIEVAGVPVRPHRH
jgi:quercetin dioxygenase-like cupin family protein